MKIQNISSVVERDWIRNKVFLISAAGVEHKVPASQNVTGDVLKLCAQREHNPTRQEFVYLNT